MMIYKVARLLCLSNVATPLFTKILVVKGKLPLKIDHVIYNSGMMLHDDLHYLQNTCFISLQTALVTYNPKKKRILLHETIAHSSALWKMNTD